MSIFKNLSTAEKRKLIKELESMPYHNKIGFNEKVATNIHWLIWKNNDYHLTEEERAKMNFPKVELIVEQRQKEIKTEMTREKVEKVLTINRVLNNEKFPAVKISDYYYNANYIKLGFSLMDKNKKIKFLLNDGDHIRQSKGKIPPALIMTDSDISIMIMPKSLDREKIIDPDGITAEDVEKARKYKTYLNAKGGKCADVWYYTDKNLILSRWSAIPNDAARYFVVLPKDNDFFKQVFDIPEKQNEMIDYTQFDFEKSENAAKHTEDLFHKKVLEAKQINETNLKFWHFYENGTGVCFAG